MSMKSRGGQLPQCRCPVCAPEASRRDIQVYVINTSISGSHEREIYRDALDRISALENP